MRSIVVLAGVLVALSIGHTSALAQKYPDRPLTWVVPFGPGTVTDNSARVVAKVLAEKIGQPVLIENKPGAGGIVGTEFVMNAKPDGYTFLYGSSGPMATYSSLYKKLSYSTLKSFTPVHAMAASPLIMVVNAASPYKNVKEFVEYAKANPDKVNFGTSGAGTSQHLTGELLQMAAGFKMTHIAYKAGASQMTDLLAGNIQVMFEYSSVVKPQIEAGKLRPLGITTAQRLKNMPDVPTFAEQGLPEVQISAWAVIMLPANAPADVVAKLAGAFGETMRDPAILAYYDSTDSVTLGHIGPKEMPAFIESETVKFGRLVEKSGARAD
jgi:tripartite-type tricarboxylate transporter receptor subunit TctC